MLYISRLIWYNKAGVVDTDDGVEEILNCDDIADVARELNLDIKGFSNAFDNGMLNFKPVQPRSTITKRQIKLKMLSGITLYTYRDIVTSLMWKPDEIHKPVSVRLSDFGSSCSDCLYRRIKDGNRHVVTVVLDDKIKVSSNSFAPSIMFGDIGKTGLGVVTDIREVTRLDTIAEVYWQLMLNPFIVMDKLRGHMEASILDDDCRKLGMIHDLNNFIGGKASTGGEEYEELHQAWMRKVTERAICKQAY